MTKRTTMLIAALALVPLGCSFYYSSESSVKTLTSPSRSSASSSDSDDDDDEGKEAYREDVRDFTAAWAETHDDVDGFAAALSAIARRHGITDWEAEDATYTAIGAGLRRANVPATDVARYAAAVGPDQESKARLVRQGFDS